MSSKKNEHYVSNVELYKAMKEYKEKRLEAEEKGLPQPRIPDYIGECILKIATRFSYRPNFINYTYREEMVSDGVENCLMYLNNFDPDKSNNPFAYFTQIIYYAFLRRIQKEKKQTYVRHKVYQQKIIDGSMHQFEEHSKQENIQIDFPVYDNANEFIKDFEEKAEKKKKARKKQMDLSELCDEEE